MVARVPEVLVPFVRTRSFAPKDSILNVASGPGRRGVSLDPWKMNPCHRAKFFEDRHSAIPPPTATPHIIVRHGQRAIPSPWRSNGNDCDRRSPVSGIRSHFLTKHCRCNQGVGRRYFCYPTSLPWPPVGSRASDLTDTWSSAPPPPAPVPQAIHAAMQQPPPLATPTQVPALVAGELEAIGGSTDRYVLVSSSSA